MVSRIHIIFALSFIFCSICCGERLNDVFKMLVEIKNENSIHIRLVNISSKPILLRVASGKVPVSAEIEDNEGRLLHRILLENFLREPTKKEFILINPATDYPIIHADQRLYRVVSLNSESSKLLKDARVSIEAQIEYITMLEDEIRSGVIHNSKGKTGGSVNRK